MIKHLVALVVFVCTVAIHWGQSEYASIQFAVFAVMALAVAGRLLSLTPQLLFPGVLCSITILLAIPLAEHDVQTVLRGCRTVLVVLVLYGVWRSNRPSWLPVSVQRGFSAAILISAALAAAQFVDSGVGNTGFFDVPEGWFALDYGTLFAERRDVLSAAGYFVRPSGFYSEPSALAAVGLVGMCMYGKDRRMLFALSFATVLLSLSLLGAILAFLILFRSLVSGRSKALIVMAAFAGGLIVAYTLATRIDDVLSGRDVSAQVRILQPLQAIAFQFIKGYYFGMNDAVARALVPSGLSTIFDNWIFNQILFYGVLGIVFVALPFALLPHHSYLLIFAFMLLNGDAFYYDRFWLLAVYLTGHHAKTSFLPARHRHDHTQ